MTNPVDDFLKESAPFGQSFRDAAVGAAGMAGAGLAIGGAVMAAQHVYDAATKSNDYRTMLEHNQDLREHADPKAVNMAFTTLRTFNPAFSKDPLVAGTYVRRIVENPTGAGGIVSEALGAAGRMEQNPALALAMSGAQSGMRYKDPKEYVGNMTAIEKEKSNLRLQGEAALRPSRLADMEYGERFKAHLKHMERPDPQHPFHSPPARP